MSKSSSNRKRVITGIWMGLIYTPFVIVGGYFFYALSLLLAYVGTKELIKMHNDKKGLNKEIAYILPLFSVLLVIAVMFANLNKGINSSNFIILCLLIVFSANLMIPLFYEEISMSDSFFYMGSILYGGLSFGLIALVRNVLIVSNVNLILGPLNFNVAGLCVFCYLLFATMFTDIGAYEVGRKLGKNKLIPDVSPNKTIEGSIGGTIIGSLMGTLELSLCEYFIGFNLLGITNPVLNIFAIFGLSLLISLVGQVGDLIASKLKREYGIKDYGTCFPGHGGVLDRFDSLILTSVVFIVILALCGVILC